MALSFRKLHPSFAAEVIGIDLRAVEERGMLEEIRTRHRRELRRVTTLDVNLS